MANGASVGVAWTSIRILHEPPSSPRSSSQSSHHDLGSSRHGNATTSKKEGPSGTPLSPHSDGGMTVPTGSKTAKAKDATMVHGANKTHVRDGLAACGGKGHVNGDSDRNSGSGGSGGSGRSCGSGGRDGCRGGGQPERSGHRRRITSLEHRKRHRRRRHRRDHKGGCRSAGETMSGDDEDDRRTRSAGDSVGNQRSSPRVGLRRRKGSRSRRRRRRRKRRHSWSSAASSESDEVICWYHMRCSTFVRACSRQRSSLYPVTIMILGTHGSYRIASMVVS